MTALTGGRLCPLAQWVQDVAKDIIFTVSQDEVNLLGRALGELPFKDVSAFINKLNAQLTDQQKTEESTLDGK